VVCAEPQPDVANALVELHRDYMTLNAAGR
jgi:hypothetical protein